MFIITEYAALKEKYEGLTSNRKVASSRFTKGAELLLNACRYC